MTTAAPAATDLCWVTNIPTPYRLPLWRELANRVPFRVVFMAATEPNREWDGPGMAAAVGGLTLAAPRIRAGEELTLYLPTPRLHRVVAASRAVLIDGWESPAYLYAAGWCRLRKIPLVYFYRGTLGSQRNSRAFRAVRGFLFRRASAVLTGGPSSTAAVRAMGVAAARIVEGVNPVDLASFTSVPRPEGATEAHRFVYVGQLIGRKNVRALLDAFTTLPGRPELTVVGDGPERSSLEAHAQGNAAADRVQFLGQLTPGEVATVLARCDTLVLPSLREVYGLVVPEALASGLHCVVSTGTGVLESVRDMRGVYSADTDPTSLAAAMAASARDWTGPVAAPEILTHTTARMADAVLEAVAVARTAAG